MFAAFNSATARGQMIAQKETKDRIIELLETKLESLDTKVGRLENKDATMTPRTLKFYERVLVLFRGRA